MTTNITSICLSLLGRIKCAAAYIILSLLHTMIRRSSPVNNMRLPMTINHAKTSPLLKPVPLSPFLPISHPPPHKPRKRGISIDSMALLYMLTLIGVVLYSKHHCNRMKIRFEYRLQDEREHWEYKKEQELKEERQTNERLTGEMTTFSGKLQSLQQQLQKQQQTANNYKNKVQTANDRYSELDTVATTTTEALKQAIQDIYRQDAVKV